MQYLKWCVAFCCIAATAGWSQVEDYPGQVEGTGTYLEITDSDYRNVALTTSAAINIWMASVSQNVTIATGVLDPAQSVTMRITGFSPDTVYYLYIDGLTGYTAMTSWVDS